jgi:glycerol-3-phosphate dehydrogenase
MSSQSARAVLSPSARRDTVARLARGQYDVLVVGGGVTGGGVALDAVTRGLRVALVEMQDFAAGTSSRSGKLVHGGLRYLEQLNFSLVRESLRERRLFLQRLCPHLVKPIQFVYPLRHRLWERPYLGAGMLLYDTLGGAGAVPRHRHLGKRTLARIAPGLDLDGLAGAVTFYDAQIDDARHTLELIRTAAAYGADVAPAVKVNALLQEGSRVVGAVAEDVEEGTRIEIRASHVVNAAGVWSSEVNALSGAGATFDVQASKGVHLLIPREKIDSTVSMFLRAEDSVLFVRTWGRHWLVGTTDTPWSEGLEDPPAAARDIEYLLRNLNRALSAKLTRDDIDAVFAGLRPLVRWNDSAAKTSSLSREHTVETVSPGLTTVVGGKYTTYRVMAKDAVDAILPDLERPAGPCRTDQLPLIGARGLDVTRRTFATSTFGARVSAVQVEHLLGRYGSLVFDLAKLVEESPALAEPIAGAPGYLAVEAVHAVTHEGALHLDDILSRRTHIAIETADRGIAAAESVAALVAPVLGWDAHRTSTEVERYRASVAAHRVAEDSPDDESAMAALRSAGDPHLGAAIGVR